MAEITGFGGAFVRADDPEALAAWYEQHLGLSRPNGAFELEQKPGSAPVILAFMARDDEYFPRDQSAMLNLQVDDLDTVLDRLTAAGVTVDASRPAYDFGRFGWFVDPEGNRVELWQPTSH